MVQNGWWGALSALLIALAVTPLVRKLAFRIGAVDRPNERKVHAGIMARMGGLGIYIAFVASALLFAPRSAQLTGILLANTLIVITGILDDTRDLSPKIKLLGQVLAALVLMEYGFEVKFLTLPLEGGIVYLERADTIFTVFWLVGVTNAVNLIDGLDGLAAGTSAIAAATMSVVALMTGQIQAFVLGLTLVGAIVGFLRYNFHPASIFMGDTGSMLLGFNLAALAILGMTKSVTVISLLLPVIILGIPILDTLWAIVRRASRGKHIFEADKKHLHHRLLQIGLSHRNTVLVIYGVNLFLGAAAILVQTLGTLWSLAAVAVLAVLLLLFARWLGALTDHLEP